MKTTNLFSKKWMSFWIIAVAVFSNADVFAQQTTMKWCTTWKTRYLDAGHGEAVFSESGLANAFIGTHRPAAYTEAQLSRYVTTTGVVKPVWEGILDHEGCTPILPVVPNSPYLLTQSTAVQRDGRRLIINPMVGKQAGEPEAPKTTSQLGEDWRSYVERHTTAILVGSIAKIIIKGNRHTVYPNFNSPASNLMPILGHIISQPGTYALPAGAKAYFRVDPDSCQIASGGAYYLYNNRICLNGSLNPPGGKGRQDVTAWKFIVGHEIGHWIADLHGGPLSGTYSLMLNTLSNLPDRCHCQHVTGSYGASTHCLTGLKEIRDAHKEGFANFFAAAVFNHRVPKQGGYVYAKESWQFSILKGLRTDLPPNPYAPYVQSIVDNPYLPFDRWNQQQCPGFHTLNYGIEMDWMKFFFELWTAPWTRTVQVAGNTYSWNSQMFTIREINRVWEGIRGRTTSQDIDQHKWDYLTDGGRWPLRDEQWEWFMRAGDFAGVGFQ